MRIVGDSLGKKYNTNWIFRDLSFEIENGQSLALIGPNGSGKSTLLQIISSALTPSKGQISYFKSDLDVNQDQAVAQINFSAPYIELAEELTLIEHLKFHQNFKPPLLELDDIIEQMGYPDARNKPVLEFSSGMKQRLKLALTFYFDGEILALDEPTSNLDSKGIEWYQSLVSGEKKRTILIASNQRYEYEFCKKQIDLVPSK